MVNIQFDIEELRPLVRAIVMEVLEEQASLANGFSGSEVLDEPKAADLLGIRSKQLAAIRRRGEIEHVVISGRFIRYTRKQLMDFLESSRKKGK